MPIAKGYLTKIGIRKGATWGTAIDTNVANQGIEILSEALVFSSNLLTDESLTGTADQGTGLTSSQTVTGTIETNFQYSSPVLATMMAMAMGRADDPVTPLGMAGDKPYAYYASYRLGDDLEGYFVSLAIDKFGDSGSTAIHEYDSVKINGMTITGAAGEFVKVSFDVIARRLRNSGTTTTSLAAATVATPKKFIRFEDFQFRIGVDTDGALTGDEQFYPTSFSLTLNNSLVGDLTSLNAPYVDEPLRDAAREITGSFEIPKFDAAETLSIENWFISGQVLKMDARARATDQIQVGGNQPYYYAFEMFMPAVQISDAQRPVSGFSKVPAPFSFTAKKAEAARDGMDGNGNLSNGAGANEESRGSFTESLRIELFSVLQSNALA